MNVLVFTSLYPNNVWPNHGVFTKERMASFARMDVCAVKVVAPVPYFPAIKIGHRWKFSQVVRQEKIDGIDVYHPRYFMTPKVGMIFYGLQMFLGVLPLVKRIYRAFDFDLIEGHYIYPDGFAAVLLGRYFKRPVVIFAEGTDINLYPTFPLIRKLERYTLRRAQKVISVCQALKDIIVQLDIPEDKISVVPNGVDPGKFYPVSRDETRKRLGLPDAKIILSVGALIPRKGFDVLIRAFEILVHRKHEQDLCLIIIGEGEQRRELEKIISEANLEKYVRLVGSVMNQDLNAWYGAADLFCLTSSREGLPCVILEALACGKPVIATEIWGIPEIIQSDKLGILTERNERDVAEGISRALTKTWDPCEIVKYARKNSWDQAALRVREIYEAVLNDLHYCKN